MGTKYVPSYPMALEKGLTPLTALLSSLPRRADRNVTPTTPTVLFGPEDHPGFALSYRGFLGTPVGRYGFPSFGRGDTPLPLPNVILWRAPGLQQLRPRPYDFGPLGTWNRRPCCWDSYWFPDTPPPEGLILTQYFPHHRISRISVVRLEVFHSLT